MLLEIRNLNKTFKDKKAVDNLSLSLKPGVYGLLGANGAGKTTLMRMICGVLKQSRGEILFDNKDINKQGEDYFDILGVLPQDFGYYPDFSAEDFLFYMSAVKGLDKSKAKEKISYLLDVVDLKNVKDKKIKTFSGGMKRRLGIAQAVLNDPKVLILDEPTTGLDPKERVKFRNLISNLSKDKIIILSTHIVSDVEYIADTILIMKDGKILLEDSAEDICNTLEGSVWSCDVEERQVDKMYEKYIVANFHRLNGIVQMRIISKTKPCDNAQNIPANLEDIYLYHFPNEQKEETI